MAKTASKHNVLHYFVTILWILGGSLLSIAFWVAVAIGGYFIFQTHMSPFDIIVGLPMLLGGAGMALNSVYSALSSVLSRQFNQGMCPICSRKY